MINPQTGLEEEEPLTPDMALQQTLAQLPPQGGAPPPPAQPQINPDVAAAIEMHKRQQDMQIPIAEQIVARRGGGIKSYGQLQREIEKQKSDEAVQMKSIAEKQKEAADAAKESLKAQQELADVKAFESENIRLKHNAAVAEMQQEEDQRREYLAEKAANQGDKLQRAKQDLADKRKDPSDLFTNSDGSTDWGNTMLASLAIALGSFGQALSGQNFNVMGIINDKINRDSLAREKEINALKEAVGDEQDILNEYEADWETAPERKLAREIQMRQATLGQLQDLAATTEDAMMSEKIGQAMAQVQQDQAQQEAELMQIGMNRADSRRNQEMALAQARKAEIAQQQAAKAKAMQQQKDLQVAGMRPTGEVEPTKEDVKKIKEGRVMVQKLVKDIEKLEEIRVGGPGKKKDGIGWEVTGMSDKAKAGKSLAKSIQLQLKDTYKLGALSGPDMELLEAIFPSDPFAFDQSGVGATIQQVKDQALQGWSAAARQAGYQDMELTGAPKNTTGNLKPGLDIEYSKSIMK